MVEKRNTVLVCAALTLLVMTALPAAGQDEMAIPPGAEEVVPAETAYMAPGEMYYPDWRPEMPVLTPAQRAQRERAESRPHPAPPITNVPSPTALAPVDPATASQQGPPVSMAPNPLAPGTATIFRNKIFAGAIPGSNRSNVMEASVSMSGRNGFYTGNWFAARTNSGGAFWNYVNPYADYPSFCCDQVTIHDPGRNTYFWLRMAVPPPFGAGGENTFRLGVSTNGGQSFCSYTVSPVNVAGAAWANTWWDYPHISLGGDYLYMTWNMFNSNYNWVRTAVLRWPMDALSACAGFSYSYFSTAAVFTLLPVHGAHSRMFFGSNWLIPNDWTKFRVYWWDEDVAAIAVTTLTIPAWTPSGNLSCGTPGNWLGRADPRVLAGTRYVINDGDPATIFKPGYAILGWWWNAGNDQAFPRPYINGVAFYEETKTLVPGGQGRPFVWNPNQCFAYPSAATNERGDVGIAFHYGQGTDQTPSVAFAMADDYAAPPPGWLFFVVRTSLATPLDNKWGDYNTVRTGRPSPHTWSASSHYIPGNVPCVSGTCATPIYFVFGRERDRASWNYYKNK